MIGEENTQRCMNEHPNCIITLCAYDRYCGRTFHLWFLIGMLSFQYNKHKKWNIYFAMKFFLYQIYKTLINVLSFRIYFRFFLALVVVTNAFDKLLIYDKFVIRKNHKNINFFFSLHKIIIFPPCIYPVLFSSFFRICSLNFICIFWVFILMWCLLCGKMPVVKALSLRISRVSQSQNLV